VSWLKRLFSMPKIIEAAINTGDALVFTDEERKQWLLEAAKVLGPQTLARRYLALIVAAVWVLATVTSAVQILFSLPQAGPFADLYLRVSVLFGGVMTFYFGIQLKRT
jgi:hypothetical protein